MSGFFSETSLSTLPRNSTVRFMTQGNTRGITQGDWPEHKCVLFLIAPRIPPSLTFSFSLESLLLEDWFVWCMVGLVGQAGCVCMAGLSYMVA